jgi:23S rRNA U2552 (ribose-2'-O)-methylase RlmE/FtsJ
MTENEIKNLFNNSENKSRKFEKYFSIYEELFEKYKNKDITFVEIGIHNGGSLDVWRKYFSKNSRIIGIDLNPECKKFERDGIEIFIGNQSDPKFWNTFFEKVKKIDVILDDGGHTNLDQIVTAVSVVKKINNGGILVVEDTHGSYIKEYNSSKKYSFIEFSKKIIDDVNFKYNKSFKQFKFSLSDHIYSVQTFESIIAFKVDKNKCNYNKLVENNGKSHEINDKTWVGNELNINFLKKILSFFKPIIRLNKLTNFFKNKINSRIISKYFK